MQRLFPVALRIVVSQLVLGSLCLFMQLQANAATSLSTTPYPEGKIRFYVKANSSFDPWTKSPSPADQRWMRHHYARMLVYSPYFDQRLQWYPNAWVYKNAYGIKLGSTELHQQSSWILRNASGRRLYIPYACNGGSCPQFAADLGNPDYRKHWLAEARKLLAKGYRGLRIDDVNMAWRVSDGNGNLVIPQDPRTGKPMQQSAYRRYLAEFTQQVRLEFPAHEIVHNVIWYGAPLNDPYLQQQILAADFIGLQRGVSDRGITSGRGRFSFTQFLEFVDRVHALDRGIIFDDDDKANQNTQNRDYELAFYLLVNQGRDLIGADGDRSRMNPKQFFRGYQLNLGTALGERQHRPQGLWQREFERGLVLVNPPGGKTICHDLAHEMLNVQGKTVASVCISAAGGVVLTQRTP